MDADAAGDSPRTQPQRHIGAVSDGESLRLFSWTGFFNPPRCTGGISSCMHPQNLAGCEGKGQWNRKAADHPSGTIAGGSPGTGVSYVKTKNHLLSSAAYRLFIFYLLSGISFSFIPSFYLVSSTFFTFGSYSQLPFVTLSAPVPRDRCR